jgi:hypothetical protein
MAPGVSLVVTSMLVVGCGGSPKTPASSAGAPGSDATGATLAADAGTSSAAMAPVPSPSDPAAGAAESDAGAGAATTPPPEHPFANNAAEATSLIDDAVSSRSNELSACVEAARARRNAPHVKIVVEVGIDQEGHMLGVKLPKGEKPDKPFVDCVLAGLRGAPFPRSHAGVITVRKTFEDKAVVR